MKITNDGISSTPLTPSPAVPPAPAGAKETDAVPRDARIYTPSAEWLQLLAQLKEQPEVREDRIQDVLLRLNQGYYDLPGVDERTAEAMLRQDRGI